MDLFKTPSKSTLSDGGWVKMKAAAKQNGPEDMLQTFKHALSVGLLNARNVDSRVHQIVTLCPRLQAVNLKLPDGFLGQRGSSTFQV